MNRPASRFLVVASVLATLAVAPSALAQDEAPPAAAPAPAPSATAEVAAPKWSLAIERLGGLSYGRVAAKDTDDSASITGFGVGGVMLNPFAAPRVGFDAILASGLTLGGSASLNHYSLSATTKATTTTTTPTGGTTTSTTTRTDDVGSATIYTLTPRIGYRIPLSPSVDLTPRAGITLAGGSLDSGNDSDSVGIFTVAVGGEGVFAFRVTNAVNLLAGAAVDYTVAATATSSSSNGARTTSTDVKGALLTLQGWVGLGVYL